MKKTRKDIASEVRSLKVDPELMLNLIGTAKMRIFILAEKSEMTRDLLPIYFNGKLTPPKIPNGLGDDYVRETFQDIACEVDSITSSVLSPCIHLNNYLESSAFDIEWDDIKHDIGDLDGHPSGKLRRISADIYASSILISIKSGLDRLVRILSWYYPGISSHTTWGRYKENAKKEGFMGVVRKGRETDELLQYFHEQYNCWIKNAVTPRDLLIHYQDAVPDWNLDSNSGALIQSHVLGNEKDGFHGYDIHTLKQYVSNWFDFFKLTMQLLAKKCPVKLVKKSLARLSE